MRADGPSVGEETGEGLDPAAPGAGAEGDASYAGLAFRQCHPDHASIAETLRAGSVFPSRFTPPGGRFGALYVALTPGTAAAELRRRAGQLGVPLAALAPRAMLTLAVRLRRVLDLTDAAVRSGRGAPSAADRVALQNRRRPRACAGR